MAKGQNDKMTIVQLYNGTMGQKDNGTNCTIVQWDKLYSYIMEQKDNGTTGQHDIRTTGQTDKETKEQLDSCTNGQKFYLKLN